MATAPTTGDAAEAAPDAEAGSSATAGGNRTRSRRAWKLPFAKRPAGRTRPRRKIRLIAVLRVLGLARRAVPRPVVGPKAYAQWWQRVLALMVLVAMMVGIGFVLAVAVGVIVVVAGFLLEQAIS